MRLLDIVRTRKLVVVPVLLIGALVFVGMVKTKKAPQRVPPQERVQVVRTLTVPAVSVVPRALGYGYVQPGQVWDAVAETSGKIVAVHPALKKGNIIGKGEVLLRIDPVEQGNARQRDEANVQDVLAQIRRLDQTEKDTQRKLKIEQDKLKLSRSELDRNSILFANNVISKSEQDTVEHNYLTQSNAVQNYFSTLNTIPAERQQLRAHLSSARSQVADAKHDEAKTVIRAPFDCRVADEKVEIGQAVKTGELLATLDSMGRSEALAQVPLYLFKNVVPRGERPNFKDGKSTEVVRDFVKLDAIIRLKLPDSIVEWTGKVVRLSDAVDTVTRTIGIYVAVDDPYLKVEGGKRPPLLKNIYAEVELRGAPRPNTVIVPRSAVHDNTVYVVDTQNRLRLRTVVTHSPQSGFVSISSGIKAGDVIVLSDVVPAIDGMLLKTVDDAKALQRLVAEATGEGSVK